MPQYLVVKGYDYLGNIIAANAGDAETLAQATWPGAGILPPRAARAWLKLYHQRNRLLRDARAHALRNPVGASHE